MAFPTIMVCSSCKGDFPFNPLADYKDGMSGLCPKCRLPGPKCPHMACSSYSTGTQLVYTCTACLKVVKTIQTTVQKPFLLPKKEEPKMKNGEIRKLPKENSPMWTMQWAVQGTAAKPYVVTLKKTHDWSCSCPNWTQHMPRTECKHILSVIVKEKFTLPEGPASMDKETAKEFAAFQKSRLRKELNIKEDWGISESRKFR